MTLHPPVERIDAHHHLWRYLPSEFEWIGAGMEKLQRDFLPEDLAPVLQEAGVAGTVVVQARQSIAETAWLLSVARDSPAIRGVVGWLPIADPGFGPLLQEFAANPRLKGLRHVVQAERPGFLDAPDFNRGMREITAQGLVYDLLIVAPQLQESLRMVDRHPAQSFVIDHIAKPAIGGGGFAPWAADMRQFAGRANVACKISGMVTETGGRPWTATELEPYFNVVLETFGPARMMAGTDWPVLTLQCGYQQWWETIDGWIAALSATERASILAGTAIRIYKLSPSSIRGSR